MDPSLGRFVSRDPLGIWEDELGSGFVYASSNPFNVIDPLGRWTIRLDKSADPTDPSKWSIKASPEAGDAWDDLYKQLPTKPREAPSGAPKETDITDLVPGLREALNGIPIREHEGKVYEPENCYGLVFGLLGLKDAEGRPLRGHIWGGSQDTYPQGVRDNDLVGKPTRHDPENPRTSMPGVLPGGGTIYWLPEVDIERLITEARGAGKEHAGTTLPPDLKCGDVVAIYLDRPTTSGARIAHVTIVIIKDRSGQVQGVEKPHVNAPTRAGKIGVPDDGVWKDPDGNAVGKTEKSKVWGAR